MKNKMLFIIFGFVGVFFAGNTLASDVLYLETNKADFWRYELVDITAKANTQSGRSVSDLPSVLQATIWNNHKKIVTVGDCQTVSLVNHGKDQWQGKWPIPFNPPLGTYKIKLEHLMADGRTLTAQGSFVIKGRKPYALPPGFSVVTYEGGKYGPSKTPGIGPDAEPSWRNLIAWADYMGADAFWHCIGQTQIWGKRKEDQFPWSQYNIRLLKQIAQAAHDAGLQYGAWITSFVVIGDKPEETGYQFTLGYNREKNALRQLRYVSLGCEKRINHMIELLKLFEADPNVDYLGLDYMRTDFGGYEFANEFVNDMSISVPNEWEQWSDSEKSLWMARLLEVTRDSVAREQWRWWRAHKVGLVIEHIVEQVQPTKPLWVFSLGWKTGHQHGQDMLMMLDAGIGFNAPMFYSIDRPDFPHMLSSWKSYLSQADASVVIGEPVDWNLLQRTLTPSGPQEHLDRQLETMAKLEPAAKTFGFFWHDLARAFFGARGPYGSQEWIMAGAASFTKLKANAKRMPMEVTLHAPVDMVLNRETEIKVDVQNTSGNTLTAVKVELVEMPRLIHCDPKVKTIAALGAGKKQTVALRCKTDTLYAKNGNQQMVAIKVTSQEAGKRNPWFDFVYLPVSETFGPILSGNTHTANSEGMLKNAVENKSKPSTIPTPKTKGVTK